jgi:hypothetical protein
MQWHEKMGEMAKKSRSKKQFGVDDLLNIESILQTSLKPITPRPEFIHDLQKGLMEYSLPGDDEVDVDLKKAFLYAFFGFAGLVFVFSIWLRLVLVVISTLGMIQSSRQKRLHK